MTRILADFFKIMNHHPCKSALSGFISVVFQVMSNSRYIRNGL